MTALARTGKSEAFAEPRIALGVLATLTAPVAVLSFLSASTIGQAEIFGLLDPLITTVLVGATAYLFSVSNAAFTAATHRRRARYELLAAMGAQHRHLRALLRWELGAPAAVGIGLGIVVGLVAGFSIAPLGGEFDANERVATWVGALTSAAFVAVPAVIGVLAAASASAKRIGTPKFKNTRRLPSRDVKRFTQLGLLLLVTSVPILIFSVFSFSFRSSTSLSFLLPEQWAFSGIALGVLGTLAGATFFTPAILRSTNRLFFPTSGTTSALNGLNDQPRRVLALSGAVLALSALTVMAAAGIISDEGQDDSPGDMRQISTSIAVLETVERLAIEDGNAVTGSAAYPDFFTSRVIEAAQAEHDVITIKTQTVALTSELAVALELSQDDVDFVRGGGALVDSDVLADLVVLNESSDEYEPLPTRRVRRGGGIGQPGPEVYVSAELLGDSGSGMSLSLLVRFEDPISPDLQEALRDSIRSTLDLPRSEPSDAAVRWVLTGLAASLLFSLALSASNLTAVELEDEFAMLVSLGASPKVRPRVLAAQSAWLLGLGVIAGSAVGVALFWLVTRGDSSVPDPIFPVGAMLTLVGTAILAAAIIRVMHSPAEPALSSRPGTTVDV